MKDYFEKGDRVWTTIHPLLRGEVARVYPSLGTVVLKRCDPEIVKQVAQELGLRPLAEYAHHVIILSTRYVRKVQP